MTFRVGNDPFAVLSNWIVEIVRSPSLHFLPNLPFYMPGVINYRGDVLPFIRLAGLFGYETPHSVMKLLQSLTRVSTPVKSDRTGTITGELTMGRPSYARLEGEAALIVDTSVGRIAINPSEVTGTVVFRDREITRAVPLMDARIRMYVLGQIPHDNTVLLILNQEGLKSLIGEYTSLTSRTQRKVPIDDDVEVDVESIPDILSEYLVSEAEKERKARLPVDLEPWEEEDLRDVCKERGIAEVEKMSKAELIEALHRMIYSS